MSPEKNKNKEYETLLSYRCNNPKCLISGQLQIIDERYIKTQGPRCLECGKYSLQRDTVADQLN